MKADNPRVGTPIKYDGEGEGEGEGEGGGVQKFKDIISGSCVWL